MTEGTYRDWIIAELDRIKYAVLNNDPTMGFITCVRIEAMNSGGTEYDPGSFEKQVGIVPTRAKGEDKWLVYEPGHGIRFEKYMEGAPEIVEGQAVPIPDHVADAVDIGHDEEGNEKPFDAPDREIAPDEIARAVAALKGARGEDGEGMGQFMIPGHWKDQKDCMEFSQRFIEAVRAVMEAGAEGVTIN